MSEQTFAQFNDIATYAKTLGHPHRLVLLDLIAQGERPVERLAELSGLSVANASQHLQQLRRLDFVQTRRDGKNILYRLGEGPIVEIISALRSYAAYIKQSQASIVQDSLYRPELLNAVSRDELMDLLNSDSVTLLDVRPKDEFAMGHLSGAKNIPAAELADRLGELDPTRPIVAYCRGAYCVMSSDAVSILSAKGYDARRTLEGPPDWRAGGVGLVS